MTACFRLPRDATVNCGQRFVLLALADAANDDGWCWPYAETVAAKTGMSAGQARRYIAWLRINGWLERERTKRDSGQYGGNRYRLNVDRIEQSAVIPPIAHQRAVLTDTPCAVAHRAPARGQEPSVDLEPSVEPSRAPQAKRTRKPKADKAVKEPTVVEARKAQAREIIAAWWDFYEKRHGKKPMGNYHGAVNAVVAALAAGHQVPHIKVALAGLGSSAVTVFGLERALAVGTMPPRSNGQSARQAEQLEAIMNA